MSLLSNTRRREKPVEPVFQTVSINRDGLILPQKCPIPIEIGAGLGIVIPGGGIYLKSAWVTIRMIRHFGCDLPIELWMLPWETITGTEVDALSDYNVTIRTAEPGYCLNKKVQTSWSVPIYLAGWQLKVQAVLQSKFKRVIYLDSDCYPLKSGVLCNLIGKNNTFLGDIVESSHLLTDAACKWAGVSHNQAVDSGAFYVQKSDSGWCEIVAKLNGPELVEQTYSLFFGDKDTWWIAHELTNTPYTVLEPGTLIPEAGIKHSIGLLHRTACKFTDGIPQNSPQKRQKRLEGDELTDEYLRNWPPIITRNARDRELIRGVLELDEYRLANFGNLGVVIDAGGHIGSFGVACRRRFPKCSIHAFEPDMDNARLYKINCPDAKITQAAMSDVVGTVDLASEGGDTAYHTTDGTTVPAIKLSDYLKTNNISKIDLLKIDIEGDEEAVFMDLIVANRLKDVNYIRGEWHNIDRIHRMIDMLRPTHHIAVYLHPWDHGYFEATRNDRHRND